MLLEMLSLTDQDRTNIFSKYRDISKMTMLTLLTNLRVLFQERPISLFSKRGNKIEGASLGLVATVLYADANLAAHAAELIASHEKCSELCAAEVGH